MAGCTNTAPCCSPWPESSTCWRFPLRSSRQRQRHANVPSRVHAAVCPAALGGPFAGWKSQFNRASLRRNLSLPLLCRLHGGRQLAHVLDSRLTRSEQFTQLQFHPENFIPALNQEAALASVVRQCLLHQSG